jgi:predicted phosphodiesterase
MLSGRPRSGIVSRAARGSPSGPFGAGRRGSAEPDERLRRVPPAQRVAVEPARVARAGRTEPETDAPRGGFPACGAGSRGEAPAARRRLRIAASDRAFRYFTVVLAALLVGLGLAGLAAAPAAPFFFIQLTDPQFGMTTSNADFAQETANLEFAVATANRLRPAFVIVTGDLVNRTGDPAQIAEYQRIMGRLDPAIRAYAVPGNHDVGNEPTPETLAAYTKRFGPDYFSFTIGTFVGIAIDSCIIHTPKNVRAEAETQDRWFRAELARARRDGARHIVVFEHHPLFTTDPAEPGGYENIPPEARASLLALFHETGVRQVFAGHYHQNALARGGDVQVVTTGPIGMPLRGAKSGMRIAIVRDAGIEHRYYDLGELPNRVAMDK